MPPPHPQPAAVREDALRKAAAAREDALRKEAAAREEAPRKEAATRDELLTARINDMSLQM